MAGDDLKDVHSLDVVRIIYMPQSQLSLGSFKPHKISSQHHVRVQIVSKDGSWLREQVGPRI